MMQPAGGMVQPPMDQQHQPPPPQYQMPPFQQPWAMMPPQMQYHQAAQPPPMWGQQASQIPPQQHMQQPQATAPTSADEIRTLWIGELQQWMDESYVSNCFAQTGEVLSVKLIRNKQTGQLEGYGFIEFATRATAERVLQTFSGQMMPNIEQTFRLNWASFGGGERRGDDSSDYSIFVGDLASDVTDFILQETFRTQYPSVRGAKIVTDKATGCSKGYGFVRFGDVNEQTRALNEMNGMFCLSRPMRIGPATMKKSMGSQQQYSVNASYQSTDGTQSENDPNNTTIFVGGLDSSVTEELLQQVFSQYGELIHIKIPMGKRCGFVQYANRASAEEAIQMLQGTHLSGHNIRLSWGRSPANKQPQQGATQWNGNYYGHGQGYEAYGYAQPQPPQDPNMYAYGAYPGYGNYQQQQ